MGTPGVEEDPSLAHRSSFVDWISLVADEIKTHTEGDDTNFEPEMDIRLDMPSPAVASETDAKSVINGRTFQQVLQLMVQQAAALDRQRTELTRLREEHSQQIRKRDERIRRSESQMQLLHEERSKAVVSMELAQAELGTLKQQGRGKQVTVSNMLPLDEHRQIMHRLEVEGANRVSRVEAEKAELIFEISRLQIELMQANSQVVQDQYPEEIVEALSKRLRKAVEGSCLDIITENERAKDALIAMKTRVTDISAEAEQAKSARVIIGALHEAERHSSRFLAENETLKAALSDCESRILEFASQCARADTNLDDDGAANKQVNVQITEAEALRDRVTMENDELKAALALGETRLVDVTKQYDEARKAIFEADKLHAESISKASDLKAEIIEENSNLKKAVSEANEQRKKVADEIQSLTEQLQKHIDDVSKAESDRDAAQKRADERLVAHKEVKEELDTLQLKLAELESRRIEILEERNEAKSSLADTEANLANITEQYESGKAALSKMENSRNEVATQLSGLQTALDRTTAEYKELKTAASAVEELCNSEKTKNKELAQELTDANCQLSDALKALERSDKERKTIEDDYQNVCKALSEAEIRETESAKEKDELQASIARVELHDSELTKKNADFEMALSQTRDALARVSMENEKLLNDLARTDVLVVDLKKQIDNDKAALTRIEESRAHTSAKNEELTTDLAQAEARLKDLSSQLTLTKEVAINEAREKLAEAVAENERIKLSLASADTSRAEVSAEKKHFNVALMNAQKACKEAIKEKERIESNLAKIESSRIMVLAENETVKLKLADAESFRAEAEIERNGIKTAHSEVQAQLAEITAERDKLRENVAGAETLCAEIIRENNRHKMNLTKAASKIEKLEGARARMAAIYGLATNTPISSPDRQHFPLNATTPTSSPPPSSHGTHDVLGPRSKRPRLSRSFLRSEEFDDSVMGQLDGSSLTHAISVDDLDEHPPAIAYGGKISASASSTWALASGSTPTTGSPYNLNRQGMEWFPAGDGGTVEPSAEQIWAFCQMFAKVSTWNSSDGQHLCGFCQLENTHGDRPLHPPLDFDPHQQPDVFWGHCRLLHIAYWRPEFRLSSSSGMEPTPSSSSHTSEGYPALTSERVSQEMRNAMVSTAAATPHAYAPKHIASPPKPQERVRTLLVNFARISTWMTGPEQYRCGLCELENTHNDREPYPSLDFDPLRQPELFWGHCRMKHAAFWRPEVRSSVLMVPDELM